MALAQMTLLDRSDRLGSILEKPEIGRIAYGE
jgi:hypothetical protein